MISAITRSLRSSRSDAQPRGTPAALPSDIALLTGGGDRPYALGLTASLASEGVKLDFIGSDELDSPEVRHNPHVQFLNLRGDVRPDAPAARKAWRVAKYYARLLRYTAAATPAVFHILWNNKLEYVDRTLLLLYYRSFGKRIVLTVHNVNARKRDGKDHLLNRMTLRTQYRLVDHLFVHTPKMKRELQVDFGVPPAKITVIPFGINDTVPETAQTSAEARQQLGLASTDKVALFFGNIAPYKGLEYLIEAMHLLGPAIPECRLVIAGRTKGSESYWMGIERQISSLGLREKIVQRIEYVPDGETESYFKAADVLVLPYTRVFQSGVLFLGYNFGTPVVATDVGSLRDEISEGETGFVCEPRNPRSLATTMQRYFTSDLYRTLDIRRPQIRRFARERYSWATVAAVTKEVYGVLRGAERE